MTDWKNNSRNQTAKSSQSCERIVKSCNAQERGFYNFLQIDYLKYADICFVYAYIIVVSILERINQNLSARSKILFLVCVFVLIPLLVLTYFQFSSLMELENKSRVAYKENLRHTLVNFRKTAEGRFGEKFIKIFTPQMAIDFKSPESKEKIKSYFSRVKEENPEVKKIMLVHSYHSDDIVHRDLAYEYSDSFREIDVAMNTRNNDHNLLHTFETAVKRKQIIDGNERLLFIREKMDCCKKPVAFVFYSLRDTKKKKLVSFLAIIINEKYIRENLPEVLGDAVLKSPTSAAFNSDIAIRIADKDGESIYENASGKQAYIHKENFSVPFNIWQAEIGLKNSNINSVARANFWNNLLLMLSVLGFLVLGLFLMIRATNREIQLAQVKSAFVSNVSHELKTPLSLIRLFVEVLELGYVKSDEKVKEYYRVINDESRRLSHLIDNILDFSNIESGRRVYNFEPQNVSEIVADIVGKYRYHLDKVGFSLNTDIDVDVPAIPVDKDAIAQAVINLVDNAVKYSEEKREITVEVKNEDSFLRIVVADSGRGIATENQQKIFEKFYRVTDGLVHDVKGSGLGLSLVKHIAEAHGGEISVKSRVGEGSRFVISLPIERKISEKQSPDNSLVPGGYKIAEDTSG